VVVVEELVLPAGSIVKEKSRMFAQNSVTAKQTMANQIYFFFLDTIDKNNNDPIIFFNNKSV